MPGNKREEKKIQTSELTPVSEMTAADIPAVLRIAEETNISRWTADSYLSEIKNENSVALSIRYRDELAGFLVARLIILETSSIQLREAEILNIAVSKLFQRKGFGQKLAEEFFRIAARKQISEIWLEVRKSNLQAIDFYKRNGFLPRNERENYYSNPLENASVMKKTLASRKNSKVR